MQCRRNGYLVAVLDSAVDQRIVSPGVNHERLRTDFTSELILGLLASISV
jgi:hypothetical protein